jgi:LacI family transcriptional regulator
MRYANAQRRWLIHQELRRTYDSGRSWPACDGAIVAGAGLDLVDEIRRRSRHMVHCSGSGDPSVTPVVCLDDVAAGAMAAAHLFDCRLERFAFYGPRTGETATNRQSGFEAEVARRGGTVVACPIDWPSQGMAEDQRHWGPVMAWLDAVPKPIGIMAVDDSAAHDLAAACLKANVAVPEQVAVIGVNNDDMLCESAWPPLSSVIADYSRMGYAAALLLDRMLAGEQLAPGERMTRLPPLGVADRQSTDVLAIDDAEMADAVRFIREHACDPCSVSDVLRAVPLGRRRLERQFVRTLGRTPHDEILRVQMEAAKRLLLEPALTLPDVAERCGFSSSPTFGRAFVRTVGTSPAAYRRAALRPKS